ncbi:hypothetical protein IWQ56_000131 [Coemansia nantahalensis]|nr:hypothetical protein IWQ56_000131 [Coemansia nantahalensis]
MNQAARAFIARPALQLRAAGVLRGQRPFAQTGALAAHGRAAAALRPGVALGARRGFHASACRRAEQPAAAALEPAVAAAGSDVAQAVAAAADPGVATQTAIQIGDLARYGLETSWPTQMMEQFLEYSHVMLGLPWWGTICAVVVGVRVAFLPAAAWSFRHQMRVAEHQPEMSLLTAKLNAAKQRGDAMETQLYTYELMRLRQRHGLSFFKPLAGNLLQFPFAILMFLALRDMVTIPITYMSSSSFLWITNLTLSDPYYILPAISALSAIAMVELQSKLTSATAMTKGMKMVMRGMAVAGALFTSKFSAALLLFWVFNASFSALQTLLFSAPVVRRWLGVNAIKKVIPVRSKSAFDGLDPSRLLGKKKSTRYIVARKSITSKD